MKKRLFAILLSIALIISICPLGMFTFTASAQEGFESGSGTESDPYIISTAEHLEYLAQTCNAGESYQGKYFKMVNDIVLNDDDMFAHDIGGVITGAADGKTPNLWTPIGFNGSFFRHIRR